MELCVGQKNEKSLSDSYVVIWHFTNNTEVN